MKTGVWKIRVPLYRTILHFVALMDSPTLIAHRQKMIEEFGGPDPRLTDQPSFVSRDSENQEIGIFISLEDFSHGLLAHEILHAAIRILQRAGHPLDFEHQEPHAYLVEYLTDWTYSCLEGKEAKFRLSQLP